ncbi:SDR family NAD(P)-dependent oxidoreductase [Sneathiella limimaris]|uniref:SDR family NAD(P)-dependent oxidoreductase n=1 Tax=Sneathiella limimaris TaxID=1964213 RepID=UPI00146A40E6|nr:SDR family oxidoreductase [Sneathiella limimaris]
MDINGAIAFVTGASGGLGYHIAEALAKEGVQLALGYLHGQDRVEIIRDKMQQRGVKAVPIKLDLQDAPSIDAAIEATLQTFGGLDLLINNAGVASAGHHLPAGDLDALTPEIWDQLMRINVRGPYLVSRAAAPHLKRSKWGRVINIGSTISEGQSHADAAYAPSKGSVIPLTRYLAAALAPDVTVNCIAPGLMEGTQMSGGAPGEYIETWQGKALLKRTTSLEDVANQAVTFCKSESVTGQTLIMDGGIHFS